MLPSDAFESSPLRQSLRERIHIESSSPNLPPLQDFIAQQPSRPPMRSGSRVALVLGDAPTTFVSARRLWVAPDASLESPETLTETNPKPTETSAADAPIADVPAPPQARDDEVVVVQIAGKTARKPRKPKAPKASVQQRSKPKQESTGAKTLKGKTGEADDSTPKAGESKTSEGVQTRAKATKPERKKQTGTMSNHFPQVVEPDQPAKPKKSNVHEPLHLEQAPARRLDWTPPTQKSIINLDSDSPAFKQFASSDTGQLMPVFKDLVGGYACLEPPPDAAPQTITTTSDEESSFLKKRKLIELVATREAKDPVAAAEKSPTKKKAPRKKARTITELATAAYKVPTQPDPNPPAASILDHFQGTSNKADSSASELPKKGKRKANQSKRVSKVSKKKAAPPKPILLSPTAALAQVAKQDFVFGTSSQLAREESPTVLRDLQAALRQSNQTNEMDFVIPINSDPIEPSEQRTSLWNAAARDAEGDLFDFEVINLTEDSPQLLDEDLDANPFGYFAGEDQAAMPRVVTEIPDSDGLESLVNLSDNLPSPSQRQEQDEGSPLFPDSELSTSTNVHQPAFQQIETSRGPPEPKFEEVESEVSLAEQPPRPNYEGLTDVQLAREIRTFGFKPIKRRSAMIALLDQCWQSKLRTGQARIHTSRRLPSAASKEFTKPKNSVSARVTERSRYRPRENSPSASGPQEPPPSAQPPETPKSHHSRPSSLGLASPSKIKEIASAVKHESCRHTGHTRHSFDLGRGPEPGDEAVLSWILTPDAQPSNPPSRPKKDSKTSSSGSASPPRLKAKASKKTTASPRRKKRAANPVIEIPDSASDVESNLDSSRPGKDIMTSLPDLASISRLTAIASKQTTPSSRRRKGAANLVIEIPDSASDVENDLNSSTDSIDEHMFSSPPPIDLPFSTGDNTEVSLTASQYDHEAVLFEHITKAIRSAPRTADAMQPSWHEKILLYDPIVLEDLATWLNAGELSRVGYDEEVNPGDVKKWCEAKSVCCLCRVNLRGKERRRF
ncbi:hypothetical protein FZEAL_7593 [Fusarium zealandicum]|uniref:Structure-specific endonuclease subunit SLX4 n=1 Tax=Fusarium zealandicum TaxID=1053134 RepID=A0A8H4XIQ3_9HYPO|nr:hypothetical protein FZEAL_7593 [Fusarium zealandicum]